MNNADMPAMPQSFAMTEQECGTTISHMGNDELPMNIGLTKREMFAMHAMQGLLSGSVIGNVKEIAIAGNIEPDEATAKMAVEIADALLKELSK